MDRKKKKGTDERGKRGRETEGERKERQKMWGGGGEKRVMSGDLKADCDRAVSR